MAIRFVLGTSGSGKTRWCIDAIAGRLRVQEDVPLVFLVPEQATFQIERAILSCPGIAGYSQLRVMSFNRLQFWLCNSSPQNELSPLGRQLLVRRSLSACVGKLGLLRNEASAGFSRAIAELIGRLHEDNCTPEILAGTAERILAKDSGNLTGRKLADIAAIYKTYLESIHRPECAMLNPDAMLTEARTKVRDAAFLRGARIWVDGFSGFTLQQQDVLFEMLAVCSDADIALCLDPRAMDLNTTDPEKLDVSSLFAPTERTYVEMLAIAQRQKFPLAEPVLLNAHPRFESAPALGRIERQFFASESDTPTPCGGAIEIVGLTDTRAEACYVAETISRLVRDTSLRYRDMAVIVPRIDAYAHYLAAAFDRNGIPYFLDRPQEIGSHPLIELLTATLRAIQSRFELSKMLALLKNRLRRIDDAAADRLDNYCRAFGVSGQDWFSDASWTFEDDDPLCDVKQIDALRRTFAASLRKLAERLNTPLSPTQFAEALFAYLDQLEVSKQLSAQSQYDPTDMQFANRRVWKKMIEVLDECLRVFDGQTLPTHEWIEILLDALSGLSLKLIPAAADQVLIGSIERSRHPDIKAAFLIGAANAMFPVPLAGEELLTEQDVRLAAAEELPLTHPQEQALDARRYLSYIALTRASQKIILTFPMLDEKSAPSTPWTGIERLCSLFSDLRIQYGSAPVRQLRFYSMRALSDWLCAALGPDGMDGETIKTSARRLWAHCKTSDDAGMRRVADHAEYALTWRNNAELDTRLCQSLFRWPMRSSESRLTTFASCPYRYFAKYILRLKKRDAVQLEPVDIGEFYHAILHALFLELRQDGRDWTTTDDESLLTRCVRLAERTITDTPQLAAFARQSLHNAYILSEAVRRLCRFLPAMKAVSAAGVFRQRVSEYDFSDAAVSIAIEPGKILNLTGRIDRVDCAEIDGRLTAIVIDYKTSVQTMSWKEFVNGLDLQLPVYLLALQKLKPDGLAIEDVAGAFYLPIELKPQDAKYENADTMPLTIKARGILNGRFVEALDAHCEKGSKYYSFAYKDGEPYSDYNRKDALRPEEFAAALHFAEQKIRELVGRLVSGAIGAYPYRLGKQSPCEHCDFRPVCKFDWQLNDYNIMPTPDKAEVMQRICDGGQQ